MKFNFRRYILLFLVSFSVILLFLDTFSTPTIAQESSSPTEFPISYSMIEKSEMNYEFEDIDSINIALPRSGWNLTEIEMNFTNIKRYSETVPVEDHYVEKYKGIYRESTERLGRGTQIKLTENTTLYGVYIFGYKTPGEIDLNVQITDYDSSDDIPDVASIYLSQTLNIGLEPNWYYQNFSSPLEIPEGDYYLVLENLYMPKETGQYFYWAYNDDNPNDPTLTTAEHNGALWYDVGTYNPHLYKLETHSNRMYYPENINMTAGFDNYILKITNSDINGSGYLLQSNTSITLDQEIINFNIGNNVSTSLLFDVDVSIKLIDQFPISGTLKVSEEANNKWIIAHEVEKISDEYSLEFHYPDTWDNLIILIDGESEVNDVMINESSHFLHIGSNSVEDGSSLEITANSPKVDFEVTIPSVQYSIGESVNISVVPPIINGYIEFILYNPFGIEEYSDVVEDPSELVLFSYLNTYEGEWNAIIYWYNATDAGMQTITFNVVTSSNQNGLGTGIPPVIIIWAIIFISLILSISIIVSKTVKNYNVKQANYRLEKYYKVRDTLNLNFVMVSERNSGLNVYEKHFKGKFVEPTLISGFLVAIRSFGIELTGASHHSQTIKLEFKNSNILMAEFRGFRLIFILSRNPSEPFIQAVDELAYEIHENFGTFIEKFNGETAVFSGITELLEKHLQISLISPMVVNKSHKANLSTREKFLLNKAIYIIKKSKNKCILLSQLLNEEEFKPEFAPIILKLMEKKVFIPILMK